MKPNLDWVNDWKVGNNPKNEEHIGTELFLIFYKFWEELDLDNKSKTTKRRYYNALHCLGGFLVEEYSSSIDNIETIEMLKYELSEDEGPLIHHDDETWQKEIDLVSRKLYKYIISYRDRNGHR
ncbi:hypothetical protein [Desulfogranum japonicum]|uniref:hypothetical protein n=1 Tax=Desulfogranum japonicum TaxID=231447 RepID=UPI00048E32B6|nr:hypothetical protein [Desulfogranum japonicum]